LFPAPNQQQIRGGIFACFFGGIGKAFLGDFFAAFVMFAFEGKNTDFGDEALTISLRKTGLAA